ncbi:MAG TPA: BTAD domain-containing putative transcriptional regulator, partial [Ilumatobacteraceae bacterium]|nr:BTAD domain-containing putative transcriptional regulator [Ilumatobacteraceae bacterium]
MIEFRALGEVAAVVDGEHVALGGARQRRLLAMLLIHRNTVVSSDRLADAVFAGEPTDAAATTLRSYIARIRRVVDGHDIRVHVVTQPPGYSLRVPDELFDAASFEAAVAEAGRCLMRGDNEAGGAAAGHALERWTGDPYPEFDDETWVQPEAQRLHELRLVAADRRFEAELACGRAADVVAEIERMVREHPVREGFRAQLMLALYRSGRQADALRAFHDYRTFLVEELGLEPSPALAELEGRILAHDTTIAHVDGGRTLHGYRLGDRLGTGRDGTLYAARVPGTDRELVLRSFRAEIADEPTFVRAFEADAHSLVALRHPAIVPLQDYWRGPHEAYLAMPRLMGGTLEDRLRKGRLRRDELVPLIERIGGALAAAGAAGLPHGRVTASNIVFDHDGLAFITDFALGSHEPLPPAADVRAFADVLVRCADPVTFSFGPGSSLAATSMADLVRDALAQLDARPAAVVNPYKGLEAFDEVDAPNFFGRNGVVDDILKRLHGVDVSSRLVLVVGGSGTGKSSVVRA